MPRLLLFALLGYFLFSRASTTSPPALPRWKALTPVPQARQEVGVALARGEVFVLGGLRAGAIGLNTAEAFNPKQNTWRSLANLPFAVHHPGAAAVGDRVFLTGGLIGGGFQPTGQTLEYDFQQDAWTSRAPMNVARGAGSTAVWAGQIYVAGGDAIGGNTRAFEVYDPANDRWTRLPDMQFAREHHAAGAIHGRIIVAGGRNGGFTAFVPQTEIYEVSTMTWSLGQDLRTPRAGCGGAVVSDVFYLLGGEGNVNDPNGIFHEVESYDPVTNIWSPEIDMQVGRHGIGAAAAFLPGRGLGLLFIPGGATRQGLGAVRRNDVMIFRP